MSDAALLATLELEAFRYFLHESNPVNGLVLDKTHDQWPASIAATGLALTCYPIGVERGWMTRADACTRVLATLRFFRSSEQSRAPHATGYRGFYYHFLDMDTGRRAWKCELSTVDTALLLAGMLVAAEYFANDNDTEREIRDLVTLLYRRADWVWARNGGLTVTHGWKPNRFLRYRWEGYDEALLLYVLGLGSPTHPLPAESYDAWCRSYAWRTVYDEEYLYAGPLFIHQLSHCWIDFRGIRDRPMRDHQSDYFDNSAKATRAQQRYAIDNPHRFRDYDAHIWGVTASDGPGNIRRTIDGIRRRFFDYVARGVPDGPDDGTLAPWSVVASLPFAPDLVLPTIHQFDKVKLRGEHPYGFKATFNPTLGGASGGAGWVSPYHFGINQGPIAVMIENHRSELVWRLLRSCKPVVDGLRKAGFTGGWLDRSV